MPNAHVEAVQEIMASQPLIFHKLVHLKGHQCLEAILNADNVACEIRKMKEDEKRRKHQKLAGSNFVLQFQKGMIEELPNETSFEA